MKRKPTFVFRSLYLPGSSQRRRREKRLKCIEVDGAHYLIVAVINRSATLGTMDAISCNRGRHYRGFTCSAKLYCRAWE